MPLPLTIREIVDGRRQHEPQFRSKRWYTRLSATEVRRQLIAQKGYTDDQLPPSQTITTKLNELGYFPKKKVAKTKPQKIPQPDAIFDHLQPLNREAEAQPHVLRLSLDAQARGKGGPFARGGQRRSHTQASDHDFKPEAT